MVEAPLFFEDPDPLLTQSIPIHGFPFQKPYLFVQPFPQSSPDNPTEFKVSHVLCPPRLFEGHHS